MRTSLPQYVVAAAALVVFSGALANGFAFDDLIHIRDNYLLRLPDFGREALRTPAFPGNLYRPATFFSYYLQVHLSGLNPLPFHAVNLALHGAVAALIYTLLSPLIGLALAFAAALLFAIHPIHVEAVANISGRAELLAAFFTLAAIYFARRRVGFAAFLRIFISTFLATCSKESALVAPFLILIYRAHRAPEELSATKRAFFASMLGGAFYLALRFKILGTIYSASMIDIYDNPLAALSPARRSIEALALLGGYLGKIIIPYPLSADYSHAVITYSPSLSMGSIVIALLVITLLGVAVWLRRTSREALLVLWFFAALILTSNIFFPIGTIFAERLVYLPSIGIIAAAIVLLEKYGGKRLLYMLLLPVAACAGTYSIRHVPVWFDTASLADYQERVSPNSFRTQLLCAARDKNEGVISSARKHVARALEILPQNEDAYSLEGQLSLDMAEYHNAAVAFEKALSINPNHAPTLNLFGRLLLNQNEIERAGLVANHLLTLQRNNPDALMILLAVALKEKNPSRAREIADTLHRMRYQSDDLSEFERLLKKL